MKRQLAAAAIILAGSFAASAQMQVLKDAERAAKEGKTVAEVISIITPAFSDPETAQLAQTYFIPGKYCFTDFDKLYALKQFNKLPEGGAIRMADDLMTGHALFMQALPLDSLPNAKGKVKPKYSKDIVNLLTGHANDFNDAAISYWEAKNFNGAYQAWGVFLDLCKNPVFSSKMPVQIADTVLGEIAFNQGIAAWQADSLVQALGAFDYARSLGYNKKTVYDYSLGVAQGLGDQEAIFRVASAGMEAYGKEDANYIGNVINYYLQTKQLDKAFTMIDDAIAGDPNNAQYYVVKGILYDNQDKKAEAKAAFKQAIDLDPYNWQALLQYGIALCNEAYALADAAPASVTESERYLNAKVYPLFREAAEYLEQSYNIHDENPDALRYLENIYYNLHDEAKMEEVKNRK